MKRKDNRREKEKNEKNIWRRKWENERERILNGKSNHG